MANPQWYKTIDLSEYTPITLTEQDRGRRFILADNQGRRQIGTFSSFSPDTNRVYFRYDGKPNNPISVSIAPGNGYRVYSINNISKDGTYPLTQLSTDLQKNIAGYYGGAKRKSRKSKRSKRIKTVKRKSKKSRKSRK